MQEKIYDLILNEDEITWQSIIYDLVKTEEMDPWDINISLLSEKYLVKIRELQEFNFFISGRIVLAASLLLRIKSVRLLEQDFADFDNLLFSQDEENLLTDDLEQGSKFKGEVPDLLIKTPLARKRKVNLNDLMKALEQALEVQNKRLIRKEDEKIIREIPSIRKIDVSALIKRLYAKITSLFSSKQTITFRELLPSEKREDKVVTFLPLLHLENQGKINLTQNEPFGEIFITGETENNIN